MTDSTERMRTRWVIKCLPSTHKAPLSLNTDPGAVCVVPVLCSPGWGSFGDTTPEPFFSSSSVGSELGWKYKFSCSVLVLSVRNSSFKMQGNLLGVEGVCTLRQKAWNTPEFQEKPSLSLAVREMWAQGGFIPAPAGCGELCFGRAPVQGSSMSSFQLNQWRAERFSSSAASEEQLLLHLNAAF